MNLPSRRRILKQHLETDRLLGVESVPSGIGRPARPGTQVSTGLAERPDSSVPITERPVDAGKRRPTVASPAVNDKGQRLESINRGEVQGCEKCELCRGRIHTVFGEGDPNAAVMFIGEGPGQNEDEQGRPFVGRAGELLNKQITAMGFARAQVYIANVVKCRPPDNRAPTPAEIDACWSFLSRQIAIIQPRVIITLGGPATKTLLQTQTGITALRGIWHQIANPAPDQAPIPVMPTFHPAYLLRSYTPDNRKKVWSDLKQVMERLQQTA